MKTRLLKKLRKEFDELYKISFIDGKYILCEYDRYSMAWSKVYDCGGIHNLGVAKDVLYLRWREYALNRVAEIRIQKTRVKL